MKKERIHYLSGLWIIIITVAVLKIFVWKHLAENYPYFESQIKMFLSIVLLRICLILLYDILEIDCFKIENNKAGKNHKENHVLKKIDNIKKKAGIWGIFFLIASLETTIGIIYFRPGYFKWNGLPNLETIFLFLLGNLWAILFWGTIIELIF